MFSHNGAPKSYKNHANNIYLFFSSHNAFNLRAISNILFGLRIVAQTVHTCKKKGFRTCNTTEFKPKPTTKEARTTNIVIFFLIISKNVHLHPLRSRHQLCGISLCRRKTRTTTHGRKSNLHSSRWKSHHPYQYTYINILQGRSG